jgi:hypothetical protein
MTTLDMTLDLSLVPRPKQKTIRCLSRESCTPGETSTPSEEIRRKNLKKVNGAGREVHHELLVVFGNAMHQQDLVWIFSPRSTLMLGALQLQNMKQITAIRL